MAAARPVLVTDVGGNSELVESGHSGVVIPAADVAALADGLLALLADEAARLALGAAARQRVQLLFSTDRFIQQYEAVYTQLGLHLPVSESQSLQEVAV
jgi:glycosyltransferase involved in cell wall biosynthesis